MAENMKERIWAKKLLASRVLRWVVGIPVVLALVLYGASYLLDESLRSNTEKKLNRDLKGYSVRLPGVHVQLIGLTATLKGLTVLQQAHPDPPVAYFPFSNQFSRGPAQARLKAKFMGSGITTASATFRPEKTGPDFDLYLKIGQTQLTAMNNVLRAYGDFDVSAGVFSLVTELHVKNGRISGYIKPFFKDMKVYDRRKDRERGVGHQMYGMLISGVASLLENRSQQEVATMADISGPVGNPEASTWQIVGQLIKNAFFKAILPSFEKGATGAGKS